MRLSPNSTYSFLPHKETMNTAVWFDYSAKYQATQTKIPFSQVWFMHMVNKKYFIQNLR